MRLLIAVRRSTACLMRQAEERTHRNQCRALSAQPIVGANSIGMRWACRSFYAATRRPASSSTCASVARLAAASFSAACRRRSSNFRRLNPMVWIPPQPGGGSQAGTLYCSDVWPLHLQADLGRTCPAIPVGSGSGFVWNGTARQFTTSTKLSGATHTIAV